MRRRDLLAWIAVLTVAAARVAAAESSMRRVGLLSLASGADDVALRAEGFRESMRSLGWIEGRTIAFEFQFAAGKVERLEPLAAGLVAARVDVIVAFGAEATIAARRASGSIPIVMAGVGDPVADRLVASLARPGGNVTGISLNVPELAAKQIELLKEVVPRLRRVAVLFFSSPTTERHFAQVKEASALLGIEAHGVRIQKEEDLPLLFRRIGGLDAILVIPNPVIDEMRGRMAELAVVHRLPSVGPWRPYAGAGFLFSYAASLSDAQRRAADFVDRILKGAKPAELPVEQPHRFELVVNVTTAWALGLTIPPSLLVRADEVIE